MVYVSIDERSAEVQNEKLNEAFERFEDVVPFVEGELPAMATLSDDEASNTEDTEEKNIKADLVVKTMEVSLVCDVSQRICVIVWPEDKISNLPFDAGDLADVLEIYIREAERRKEDTSSNTETVQTSE